MASVAAKRGVENTPAFFAKRFFLLVACNFFGGGIKGGDVPVVVYCKSTFNVAVEYRVQSVFLILQLHGFRFHKFRHGKHFVGISENKKQYLLLRNL